MRRQCVSRHVLEGGVDVLFPGVEPSLCRGGRG